MNWYAVKTINKTPSTNGFEERIFVVSADNWDLAWDRAETCADEYAHRTEEHPEQWQIVDMFHLFDDQILDGSEVYSKTLVTDKNLEEMRQKYEWLYETS